jgi:hypothetical protein
MDVPYEVTTPKGDSQEDEARAEEIIEMISMELQGASPTVTQLVLKRLPDEVALQPTHRGPAKARRRGQEEFEALSTDEYIAEFERIENELLALLRRTRGVNRYHYQLMGRAYTAMQSARVELWNDEEERQRDPEFYQIMQDAGDDME